MKKIIIFYMVIISLSSVFALDYRFPLGNLNAYGNNLSNVTLVTATTGTFTALNVVQAPTDCANYSNYFMTFWNGTQSTCTPINTTGLFLGTNYDLAVFNSSSGIINTSRLTTDANNNLYVWRSVIMGTGYENVGDIGDFFGNSTGCGLSWINSSKRVRIDGNCSNSGIMELDAGTTYVIGSNDFNFDLYSDTVTRQFFLVNAGTGGANLRVDDNLTVDSEITIGGVGTTSKILCRKSDGYIGECSGATNSSGQCTCA